MAPNFWTALLGGKGGTFGYYGVWVVYLGKLQVTCNLTPKMTLQPKNLDIDPLRGPRRGPGYTLGLKVYACVKTGYGAIVWAVIRGHEIGWGSSIAQTLQIK